MLAKCCSSSASLSWTSIFHRRPPQLPMKTTTGAQPWPTPQNPPPERPISTSNTLPYVIGLNATLSILNKSINIADHLSKPLLQILLHQHAAFLLRHVPPKYSPVYQQAITTYCNRFDEAIDRFIPESYTTPMTATAATIHAPTYDDMRGNPWLIILWHD